ncbi:GATOR complex protein MIOS isoform X2 [Schistocerca serialis cubense]|nr:GATOR complex protein MIOS isoform X2 [Schistocerca serialis cubense]
MSGIRLEVQWSRSHPTKFITWGTEIYLYEVLSKADTPRATCIKVSDSTYANLLATNSSHHYIKCIDIFPHPEPDILLAVGQASGKVTLTAFGPTVFDSRGITGKELVPRHSRQCNGVAWSPVDSNLLAVGLDKNRADHSLLVWDLTRCHLQQQMPDSVRPCAELGLSETTHSLAWLQPRNIVLGMNSKHLKVFDIRDSNRAVNATNTKAVFGVCIDPHMENQLASFIENQIYIWDLRNFEKPVLTLNQGKPVTKILWCPTRRNLLGSLLRDSCSINLHDIRHTVVGTDEVEPTLLERSVQPCSTHSITSFSWHPASENRLIAIDAVGSIRDYIVSERITVNCSPRFDLVWIHGGRSLKKLNENFAVYGLCDDISTTMKKRAMNEYGLKPDISQNGRLAEDEMLNSIWKWVGVAQSLVEEGVVRANCGRIPGIRNILRLEPVQVNMIPGMKSEMVTMPWADLGSTGAHVAAKIYKSEERDKALQLCGWKIDSQSLSDFLDGLEVEGSYSRAAAIAVFNLRLRLAVEMLNRGASRNNDSKYTIVAMALSGFSDDKNSMWRELCITSRTHLSDPYLRALFAFLTADSENYDGILNEAGIAVSDKVAFACVFLSDVRLADYLQQLTVSLTEEGSLSGFLLTGSSGEIIQIMQNYVNNTGDVQSVSLLAIQTFTQELLDNDTTQSWIESYRDLLDTWQLWNQRAQFDIVFRTCCPSKPPAQQVFVSCNFCGKSISAQMQGHNKNRGPFARLGTTAQKLKMSACPQCRKPLPRCAICLMHMGTASGTCPGGVAKLTEFSSWFTWCQTCRHGGHAGHMAQWFREHLECPVTACNCRCLSLDAASQIGPLQLCKA